MPIYTVTLVDGRKQNIFLPFHLSIETESELVLRAGWFWNKEPETLAWLRAMPKKCVLWDVGANVGCFSLFFAYDRPLGTCIAFEPFKPNFDSLSSNVELNRQQNIIKCEHLGLSDQCGTVEFTSKNTETGSSGGQIGTVGAEMVPNVNTVHVLTGDAYAEQHGYPNFVKIDVDGQELRVLRGMDKVLQSQDLKSVLVEDNTGGSDLHELMLGYGFKTCSEIEQLKNRSTDLNRVYLR